MVWTCSLLVFFHGLEALPLGSPEDFPELKKSSLQIQPGREHDLKLGAQVVVSFSIPSSLLG